MRIEDSLQLAAGSFNSGTTAVSIARMQSPSGWVEPGQTPEFDESRSERSPRSVTAGLASD